ncbi:MAG: type II secretion system protein [Bdellovibrionales bacterium]
MMRANKGFTLIEVLVALFILTGGIIVLSTSWSGNFMRIRKSALFNDVAVLLERKMVETEAKYRNKYKEIPEEDAGEFDKDHPQYSWKLKSRELKLPDITPLLLGQEEHPDETMVAMLKQLTEQLSKAIKEVKISVLVKRNGKELEFSATEYMVDYGSQLDLGGVGGAAPGGSGSGGTSTGGGKTK